MKTRKALGTGVVWRRAAITLLLLMLSSAVAAFLLQSRVHMRASTNVPPKHSTGSFPRFAPFFPGTREEEIDVREIAQFDGSLWESTGVRLDLIFIRSGVVVERDRCSLLIGTSGSRLDHPLFRYQMRGHVVLGRAEMSDGAFAALGAHGGPSGGAKGPTRAPREAGKVRRGYDRTILRSRKEIIYVEGDEEPSVFPGMSLDEFCRKNNRGEYLVVVASLQ